jgi:hypothetical protein
VGQGICGEKKNSLLRREETMKDRSANTDAESARIVFQADIADERSKNAPPAQEIRKRAFEIHIERGGIHGCELDDWLQAEREFQERYENDEKRAENN